MRIGVFLLPGHAFKNLFAIGIVPFHGALQTQFYRSIHMNNPVHHLVQPALGQQCRFYGYHRSRLLLCPTEKIRHYHRMDKSIHSLGILCRSKEIGGKSGLVQVPLQIINILPHKGNKTITDFRRFFVETLGIGIRIVHGNTEKFRHLPCHITFATAYATCYSQLYHHLRPFDLSARAESSS